MAKGKKTGGRVKGTPNKAVADLRAQLEEMGYGNAVRNMAALAMRVDPRFVKTCKKADLALAARLHDSIAKYTDAPLKAIDLAPGSAPEGYTLSEIIATYRKATDGS